MKLTPVLDAYIPESKRSQKTRAKVVRQLENVLASKKSSTAEWEHLTAAACVTRATGSEVLEKPNDAQLVIHS